MPPKPKTNVPQHLTARGFPDMRSELVQQTEEISQDIAKAANRLTALVMRARDEDELTAAYIQVYRVARDLEDAIKENCKPISAICEEFKLQKLPEAFDAASIQTLTLDTGDRVSLSDRVLASIKAGMKEAVIKWCKASKTRRDLITETINASTLNAYAKSLLEQNLSLPDDLFNVTIQTQASLTRGKKK